MGAVLADNPRYAGGDRRDDIVRWTVVVGQGETTGLIGSGRTGTWTRLNTSVDWVPPALETIRIPHNGTTG